MLLQESQLEWLIADVVVLANEVRERFDEKSFIESIGKLPFDEQLEVATKKREEFYITC